MDQVLLAILLVWIIGIPALAIAGAMAAGPTS